MNNSNDLLYVGVDDHQLDLFEGQYSVPNGMAYNSYVLLDDKTAVLDTVDRRFTAVWLDRVRAALGARSPDYLVVHHMEPDHSASILDFMTAFPSATVVASAMAFNMMRQFFGTDFADRRLVVKDGDTLPLGSRTLSVIAAPMIHWPEVVFTFDPSTKTLFSADAFGKFGALDADEDWACEARRYYFGIVGKYGPQVQAALAKIAPLGVRTVRPLHGPVLEGDALGRALSLYSTWSAYRPETPGALLAYTSVYGHTKEAVALLADALSAAGCPKVAVADLARDDMAEALEDAFRYPVLVLASTTYNAGVFPFMETFIRHLAAHAYRDRLVGIVENGSWAPMAAKTMRDLLAPCPNLSFAATPVRIRGGLDDASTAQLRALAAELAPATRF